MLSINTINDSGLIMLSKLGPRYTPTDRTTLARNYIPAMHECEKCTIINMQSFTIITDGQIEQTYHYGEEA